MVYVYALSGLVIVACSLVCVYYYVKLTALASPNMVSKYDDL